ncbi:PIN domain-containing protein [Bradyrhizobium brasilense]|uniref:PIN domain-containing protein n=1 Tax=Bradyrhizobium brasilense TaxID=1419277 RepID=UPI002877FEAC|nr:PIN domain-containing protein [Bradyrhizobium brasilense]MCP3414252.1 PIN domain-containing protein [Bradyrhizobium brasilense]
MGYDTVVIILTKPVLDEIDKHKKSPGRTRARALEIFSRIREMLTTRTQEIDIRSAAPRVVLRKMASARADQSLVDQLDYAKPDERLIGIVSTLNAQATGYAVKLFTDDVGPAGIADDLGIPFLLISQNWRRPAAESAEGKRVKELEKDLALYRAQEPRIVIRCETTGTANKIRVVRKIAQPLSEAQIEQFVGDLCRKHPVRADFTPPPISTKRTLFREVETTEYSAPSDVDSQVHQSIRAKSMIQTPAPQEKLRFYPLVEASGRSHFNR